MHASTHLSCMHSPMLCVHPLVSHAVMLLSAYPTLPLPAGSVTVSNVFNQPGLQATFTGTPAIPGKVSSLSSASLTVDYTTPYARLRCDNICHLPPPQCMSCRSLLLSNPQTHLSAPHDADVLLPLSLTPMCIPPTPSGLLPAPPTPPGPSRHPPPPCCSCQARLGWARVWWVPVWVLTWRPAR
jgi:hypothetical protein